MKNDPQKNAKHELQRMRTQNMATNRFFFKKRKKIDRQLSQNQLFILIEVNPQYTVVDPQQCLKR